MTEVTQSSRILFVDRFRGLAVMAMFFVHTAVAWLQPQYRGGDYWYWFMKMSGLVAPSFLFLVGLAMVMAVWRVRATGGDERALRRHLVRRGVEIWVLGYALHFTFWALDHFWGSWTKILRVDVLHCIGSGLVVLPWIAWPRRYNWSALGLFFLIAFLGQVFYYVPFQNYLPSGLAGYVTLRSHQTLFPVVPNWAWMALGLVVGGLWVPLQDRPEREVLFWVGLLAAMAVLQVTAFYSHWLYYHRPIYVTGLWGYGWPRRGLFHLVMIKAVLVLGLFALMRLAAVALDRLKHRPIVLLGETSLFVYSVHLMFVYHIGGKYLRRRLDPTWQFIGACILAVVMFVLAAVWYRKRRAVRQWLDAAWSQGDIFFARLMGRKNRPLV